MKKLFLLCLITLSNISTLQSFFSIPKISISQIKKYFSPITIPTPLNLNEDNTALIIINQQFKPQELSYDQYIKEHQLDPNEYELTEEEIENIVEQCKQLFNKQLKKHLYESEALKKLLMLKIHANSIEQQTNTTEKEKNSIDKSSKPTKSDILSDITVTLELNKEKRRLEEQEDIINQNFQKNLQKALEKAQRSKMPFVILIMHDIKTVTSKTFTRDNASEIIVQIITDPINTFTNHAISKYHRASYTAIDSLTNEFLNIRPAESIGLASKEKRILNQAQKVADTIIAQKSNNQEYAPLTEDEKIQLLADNIISQQYEMRHEYTKHYPNQPQAGTKTTFEEIDD